MLAHSIQWGNNDVSPEHCHDHHGIKAESMEGPRRMRLPVGWHSPLPWNVTHLQPCAVLPRTEEM